MVNNFYIALLVKGAVISILQYNGAPQLATCTPEMNSLHRNNVFNKHGSQIIQDQ